MEEVMACGFCVNASIDDELQADSDLSYMSLGKCERGYRVLFRSGDGKPTELLFERWHEKMGWKPIGYYQPQYCPNCGRKLIENEIH